MATCEMCGEQPVLAIGDRRSRRPPLRLCDEHSAEVSVKRRLYLEGRK